jgi:hypothetical protein
MSIWKIRYNFFNETEFNDDGLMIVMKNTYLLPRKDPDASSEVDRQ